MSPCMHKASHIMQVLKLLFFYCHCHFIYSENDIKVYSIQHTWKVADASALTIALVIIIIIICVYYDMTVAHQYSPLKNEKLHGHNIVYRNSIHLSNECIYQHVSEYLEKKIYLSNKLPEISWPAKFSVDGREFRMFLTHSSKTIL